MKPIYLISIFIFFQTFQLNSQIAEEINKINTDSLQKVIPELEGQEKIDALNKIALAFFVHQPDSCINIANNTIQMSEKIGYQKGIADGFFNLGNGYLFQDSIKLAVVNFLSALRIYESLPLSNEMGLTCEVLSMLNWYVGRTDKALEYNKKGIKVFHQLSNHLYKIRALNKRGLYFTEMSVFDSAEYNYYKALELLQKYPDTVQILNIYQNLSYNMIMRGDKNPENKTFNEQSIVWSKKALKLINSYNFHQDIRSQCLSAIYYNLAECYLELGLEEYIKTSLEFIQKAQDYAYQSDYSAVILVNYCLMAHIKFREGKSDSAIILYKMGLHESDKNFSKHSIDNSIHQDPYFHNLYYDYSYKIRVQWAYDSLYFTYYRARNYDKALQYYDLKEKAKEEIFNEHNKKLIAILEADSENERDQTLILKLQNKNLKLKNQSITYLSGGSGLVLVFLFFFAYSRQRNKKNRIITEQKIYQLEEEKKLLAAKSILEGQEEERKRIARELHDGLGVLLSSAKMHFSSIRNKIPEANPLVEKATKLLEEASRDVRRISHNMMPGLLTKFGLYEAMEDLFEQVEDLEGMHAEIKIEGEQSRLKENIEIMLYRILQEMVNNTLKHAKAKNIKLELQILHEKLIINYNDDGKGFDFNKNLCSKSLGLTGLQSRVKLLGGELNWISSPGEGTSYYFEVNV